MKRYAPLVLFLAVLFGALTGTIGESIFLDLASVFAEVFIRLLKFVSLPIIFLSIVATASSMKNLDEIKWLGGRVGRYTLLTTLIAATLALSIFLLLDPVNSYRGTSSSINEEVSPGGYLQQFIGLIPENIVRPFLEANVIGVLLIAMALALAILHLPDEERNFMAKLFRSLYSITMFLTEKIILLMPIAIWAFVALFFRDLHGGGVEIKGIAVYLVSIILANVLQGIFVLPLLLKAKGISAIRCFKAMAPALSLAFFSKSSSAALPLAVNCAKNQGGIHPKVAAFSLPLCTTINMNGCAAFILITTLFVSSIEGVPFTLPQMMMWIFVATVAAIGNAGVPMGCYFMTSAFLALMNVPLTVLGVILPFYSMIDMLESALNVWSDSCVTFIVNQEYTAQKTVPALSQG